MAKTNASSLSGSVARQANIAAGNRLRNRVEKAQSSKARKSGTSESESKRGAASRAQAAPGTSRRRAAEAGARIYQTNARESLTGG